MGSQMMSMPSTPKHPCNLLSEEFELMDPNPDIHALFIEYDRMFFDGKLSGCEVRWSPRMTLCAGLCQFERRSGYCSIRLSEPLLKLRPRSDLVNTLLHEMIHAYIFVFSPIKDHDDHGSVFQAHMRRINTSANTKITVYHTFHDEVDAYRVHWWQCDGPCRQRRPYFGVVKRAMNRPPGPSDRWWKDHQTNCGGTYTKIKEPEGFQDKKKKKQQKKKKPDKSIKDFFDKSTDDKKSTKGKEKAKKDKDHDAMLAHYLQQFFDDREKEATIASTKNDVVDLTEEDDNQSRKRKRSDNDIIEID